MASRPITWTIHRSMASAPGAPPKTRVREAVDALFDELGMWLERIAEFGRDGQTPRHISARRHERRFGTYRDWD